MRSMYNTLLRVCSGRNKLWSKRPQLGRATQQGLFKGFLGLVTLARALHIMATLVWAWVRAARLASRWIHLEPGVPANAGQRKADARQLLRWHRLLEQHKSAGKNDDRLQMPHLLHIKGGLGVLSQCSLRRVQRNE